MYWEMTYNKDGSHRNKENISKSNDELFEKYIFGRTGIDCVYLVFNFQSKRFKIGRTTNIDQRFSALKSQSGCDLELVMFTYHEPGYDESAEYLEKTIHKLFGHKRRKGGEWFNFSIRDLIMINSIFMNISDVEYSKLFNTDEDRVKFLRSL
jgi:hypothetical protein